MFRQVNAVHYNNCTRASGPKEVTACLEGGGTQERYGYALYPAYNPHHAVCKGRWDKEGQWGRGATRLSGPARGR